MFDETELIVKAIEGLRQESNFFKDYMFPLVSGFFSSLLGAGVAYFVLKHQENIQIEKEKMDIANKWMFIAENAFSSLIGVKANYSGKLDVNPGKRSLVVPRILINSKPVNEEISGLFFIIPKKDDKESCSTKWREIPRIRALIENYNTCLDLWEKRSSIRLQIEEKLSQENPGRGYLDVTQEKVIRSVGSKKYVDLINFTERAIILTDDIIVEIAEFLEVFPSIAKVLIKTNRLKRYGSILTFNASDNKKLMKLLVKTQEVDYDALSKLYGRPAEEIKKEYSNSYKE